MIRVRLCSATRVCASAILAAAPRDISKPRIEILMTDFHAARDTMAQALTELGLSPSSEQVLWMLGLVGAESNYGQTPDWIVPNKDNPSGGPVPDGPSNNWGAVTLRNKEPYTSFEKGYGYILHWDSSPGSGKSLRKFQRSPSQLEGAKVFLSTLLGKHTKTALGIPGATPTDLARGMYMDGYYGGYHCGLDGGPSIHPYPPKECKLQPGHPEYQRPTQAEADEMNVAAYANMITSGANRVRAGLKLPPAPVPATPASPSNLIAKASGTGVGILGLGLILGGVAGAWKLYSVLGKKRL